MDVKLKKSKNDSNGYTHWGFVEKYKVWKYGTKGYIEVVLGLDSNTQQLSEPYVFRGEEFIKASQIDEEMGISKYIKAKKPFYSLLERNLVLKMHVAMDFNEKSIIEDKCYSLVYKPTGFSKDGNRLNLVRYSSISDEVKAVIESLFIKVLESCGDREVFIRSRFR